MRVDCGHLVRALRELCVTDASTVREQDADVRSVPLKWHALPRHIACHCGNKSRASVSAPLRMLFVVCDAFNVLSCSRCFQPTTTSFELH